MKLGELARDYLRRGEVRVRSAEMAQASGDYPDVVRFSQEAVELSLKAALRSRGVEYPKEHDVGKILLDVAGAFPAWFNERARELMEISSDLASKRAAAMYGLEQGSRSPEEIFGDADAVESLASARKVFDAVTKLLAEP